MDRPGFCEHSDVAWLILGHLSCYPDARDTVEGIQHWWLGSLRGGLDVRKVQGALDDLVEAGWVLPRRRRGTGMVYGLNAARRQQLHHILQPHAQGQETAPADCSSLDE